MTSPESTPPNPKAAARKRLLFALILAAAAVFMYVSFIVKTAVKGP